MLKELVWHLNGPTAIKTDVGPAYRLRGEWRPVEVWVRYRDDGILSKLIIDINDDGVSLFENKPEFFNSGTQSDLFRAFNSGGSDSIADGSVITLDVDAKGGHDITVILYLEPVREPNLLEVVK